MLFHLFGVSIELLAILLGFDVMAGNDERNTKTVPLKKTLNHQTLGV